MGQMVADQMDLGSDPVRFFGSPAPFPLLLNLKIVKLFQVETYFILHPLCTPVVLYKSVKVFLLVMITSGTSI